MVKSFVQEPTGVTDRSTEFVHRHLPELGPVVKITGLLRGDRLDQVGEEHWVVFTDPGGNEIAVDGFSWGYAGEGPHGLARMARELGFDLPIERIARLPQDEGWTVVK